MGQDDAIRDAVVVGGGAAGLSAALTLARARRSVAVVDAGQPRNAPAEAVHGLLALEGIDPGELLTRGRAEVTGYGGEVIAGEVNEVRSADGGFAVYLRGGGGLRARRLVIATGLVDELPDVAGLRERWGRDVLHCPYCHGWEVRDRAIGVLAGGAMSVHQALMFRQWSDELHFFTRGHELTADDRAKLNASGIDIITGAVAGLQVSENHIAGVRMQDGRAIGVEAVAVATRMVARAEAFADIGIKTSPHPTGEYIDADSTGRTPVPGVWAAGNVTNLSAQVGTAAAEGTRAAQHINADLVTEDVERALERGGRSHQR